MPNIKSITTGHNNKLLHTADNPNKADVKRCNCRSPDNCPLDGNCCVSSVVYKATLTSSNPPKKYYGCCSTLFKTKYDNHKQTFLYPQKKSATELPKAYWELKEEENGRPSNISWSMFAMLETIQLQHATVQFVPQRKAYHLASGPYDYPH